MDSFYVETGDLWMEHYLSSSEPLVSNQDLSAIWELVVLLAGMGCLGLLDGLVEVVDDVAHLFLDVSDDFQLSIGCERVTSLVQDLLKIIGNISTG